MSDCVHIQLRAFLIIPLLELYIRIRPKKVACFAPEALAVAPYALRLLVLADIPCRLVLACCSFSVPRLGSLGLLGSVPFAFWRPAARASLSCLAARGLEDFPPSLKSCAIYYLTN